MIILENVVRAKDFVVRHLNFVVRNPFYVVKPRDYVVRCKKSSLTRGQTALLI